MFSLQKWKCSWSLAATIAAILALASVVHLFLYPLVSPFDYLSLSKTQNSCLPVNGSTEGSKKYFSGIGAEEGRKDSNKKSPPVVDLNIRYPDNLHDSFTYRGTPWKSEIGRWLSGCDSNTTTVKIIEKIGGKSCRNDCSGQGICNRELGQCCCFNGFRGKKGVFSTKEAYLHLFKLEDEVEDIPQGRRRSSRYGQALHPIEFKQLCGKKRLPTYKDNLARRSFMSYKDISC